MCTYSVIHVHVRVHTYTCIHTPDESDGGSGDEDVAEGGRGNPITAMQEKLKELSAAHDLVIKNNALLVKQIADIEGGAVSGASLAKLKEKLALFKLTSDAMAKVHVHVLSAWHVHVHIEFFRG